MACIELQDVHFKYEDGDEVLKGLDLSIDEGEIFGFLGPNGAGKSTTFKVMVGFLEPTRGKALIGGKEIQHEERKVYQQIGYMPDIINSFDNLTVYEFLHYFGLAHNMTDKQIKDRCDDMLNWFQLTEKRDVLMSKLSLGQKQSTYFLRAMIHDPSILLLDEPASGLDPGNRMRLRRILEHERQHGKTIMISSHILRELEDLCTSLGILQAGRFIEHGRVEELWAKYQNPVSAYRVKISEKIERARQVLSNYSDDYLKGVKQITPNILELQYKGTEDKIATLLEMIVMSGARVVGLEKREKNIEKIYEEITNE